MKNLTPNIVKEKMQKERDSVCFVDVRSQDEFSSGHVPGATCIPLDKIESGAMEVPRGQLVVLSCQSGKRSARAKEILRARGFDNVVEMEGGFSAWTGQGFPVNRFRKSIPVIRQVLIAAGSLVLSGTLLGLFIHPGFFAIPLFMGAGLTFAGSTGWCGLAFLLERMPWNRNSASCSAV